MKAVSFLLLLFLSTQIGSFAGLFFAFRPFIYGVIIAIFSLALFARHAIYRVLAICFLTACLCALSAHLHFQQYAEDLKDIPKTDAVFQGRVLAIAKTLEHEKLLTISTLPHGLHFLVKLQDAASFVPVEVGDMLRIFGHAGIPEKPLSPGQIDSYLYYFSRNIHASMFITDPRQFEVIYQTHSSSPARFKQYLQEQLILMASPRDAAVLLALIVGDTSFFDAEQKSLYLEVGAGHLLAVSGLQISFFALLLYQLLTWLFLLIPHLGRFGYAQLVSSLFTLVIIWGYTALCLFPASAVRAAIMATAMLLAIGCSKYVKLIDVLSAAGLIHVLVMPQSVLDPSFLLSYGAMFGLVLAAEVEIKNSNYITLDWIKRGLIASLAASLLTFPISLHLFGSISIGGILANTILVPCAIFLQAPAIILAFVGIFLHSHICVQIAAFCAGLLEALCETFSQWLGGLITWYLPSGLIATMFVICLACFFLFFIRRRYLLALSFCAVACLAACYPLWREPNGLRITSLPVGHGDATVVEFPSGQVMLIDGGGDVIHHKNIAERILIPFFQRRHINSVDIAVLSHPDPDHILGLIDLAKTFEIRELWHSGFDKSHPLMRQLLNLAQKKKIAIKQTPDLLGTHRFGKSEVEVMAPDQSLMAGKSHSFTNNQSLVLIIKHAGLSALWPGDLEQEGEALLIQNYPSLHADIVKVPHHGSSTSSTPLFVETIRPSHVLVSTGRKNPWGFPHQTVIQRWQNVGATIYHTGIDGEILTWLTSKGVIVHGYTNHSKPLRQDER